MNQPARPPRIALVHDYLVERGGAEKVLAALHASFPDAPIHAAVYNPSTTLDAFRAADVRTSFLQRLTHDATRYRALAPLYPLAFHCFDLSPYDVVLSSASGFAKGVRVRPDARHICYCYTPPRFAWGYQRANGRERLNAPARLALRALGPYLRWADRWGARGVDHFLTSSTVVAQRIADVYRRQATVLPPPIECRAFAPAEADGDFFLVLSRLVPYKRIDIAIEAFSRNRLPLVVVGDGRDRGRLESLARSDRIRFLGHQPDAEVRRLLAACRALVVPAEEDFGMAALEANASGRPVIACASGGARDTVLPGITGILFDQQSSKALAAALEAFEHTSFDRDVLLRHARRFETSRFQDAIHAIVAEELALRDRAAADRQPTLQREEARS
jgi:glycosyltransferase involved in cell wall biosynthesis